ncbi:D-alanine--D-alanine ligase [bacterium]|nr:D-alanine--D-alanine ligase [bacterium]
MNLVIFAGGTSSERDVSLSSSSAVFKAMHDTGHSVTMIDTASGNLITPEMLAQIGSAPPDRIAMEKAAEKQLAVYSQLIDSDIVKKADAVFLGLHGGIGENGKLQSLLDLAKIRYTGSGVLASALAMNKVMSKRVFESIGVPTPQYLFFKKDESHSKIITRIETDFRFPLIVKPNEEGSTVGLSLVKEKSELTNAIHKAAQYSDILVEEYIAGRELTVAVVGGEALPVIEIIPQSGFYDYEHKYTKGKTQYVCPADISPNVADDARRFAKMAFDGINCQGYARIDFRLSPEEKLYCLEVNTLPGMTATSLVPKAAKAVGMEFDKLIEKIIQLAIAKT